MQTLNFGLIGVGRFGKHYIRLLQKTKGVKLVAVAAKTKKSLLEVSNLLRDDVLQLTNSDALLKMKTVDCVIIATPASTHFAIAKMAIEARKNVLLEKPMVKNLAEAKELRKIVKKSRKVFMVAHQYVYNDCVGHLKKELKKGTFGKVNFVFADHFYPGPVRNDIGCFWDAGTHIFSIVQHLLNPGKITKVSGSPDVITKFGFDGFTQANVHFSKGLDLHLAVSCLYPEKSKLFAVVGSKKSAIFDDVAKTRLRVFQNAGKSAKGTLKASVKKIKYNEPLQNELGHFVYCIRNKKEPLTGIESSYEITEWLDKVSKSIKLPKYK